MTTYEKVVQSAEKLLHDDTKDTWGLADAVLAYVPDATEVRVANLRHASIPPSKGESTVPNQLRALADKMEKDEVLTPTGNYYTESSLKHLRDAAMIWPRKERHTEAAYSTHRDAGSPAKLKGEVLAALCAVARGEYDDDPLELKPDGVGAKAWRAAVKRVEKRDGGFLVTANDIAVALKKQPNSKRSNGAPTVQAIKDAVDAGALDAEDLAELGDVIQEAADIQEAQDQDLQDRTGYEAELGAAGTEAMENEYDEFFQGVAQFGKTLDAIDSEHLGSKLIQNFRDLELHVGFSLKMSRKYELYSDEHEVAQGIFARIRHYIDLMEMATQGATLTPEDQEFLDALGKAG
jgi:hypothetical protein